jgi:pyruvate/2-oxoglutarate dehydrogenase complex dihydrolipoamide acyltransferase (E2) component
VPVLTDVVMPKLGDSMVDAEVVEWLVEPGARVGPQDPIVNVDTGKALTEVVAPASGVLVEAVAAVGEVVPIGGLLARIQVDG